MVDPNLWNSIPFGNRTAWTDFLGQHALWHQALHATVVAAIGVNYRTYPLGEGGGRQWLQVHQQEHLNAARAIGLAGPGDLSTYDLQKEEEFASWIFLHAQDSSRLRRAAGLS